MNRDAPWGVMAEFERPGDLVAAARRAREAGFRRVDAYSPFPVEGLDEAMGLGPTRLPLLVLLGGLAGGAGGFALQYYLTAVDYPLNVGGRPLNSWPAFIVIAFELTVLVAALTAVLGMLTLNGLPRPHHPVFNVPRFALATRDRFFLAIEAADPAFGRARRFLEGLNPHGVYEVDA